MIVEPESIAAARRIRAGVLSPAAARGVTCLRGQELMNDRNIFGSMMVRMGDADALVSGVTQNYPDTHSSGACR